MTTMSFEIAYVTEADSVASINAATSIISSQYSNLGGGLKFHFVVLLQFSWRRGFKDSGIQGFKGLLSKDFISAFNILSISAMSFLVYPIHLF